MDVFDGPSKASLEINATHSRVAKMNEKLNSIPRAFEREPARLLEFLRAKAVEDLERAAELNSKQALLSAQEKLISSKEEENKRLLREIESLKSSRSWRITAPCRLLDRLLSNRANLFPNLIEEAASLVWRAGVRFRLTGRTKELSSQIRLIYDSGLFDFPWYRDSYGKMPGAEGHPILHYLRIGTKHGCNPNRFFDTNWYLKQYPQVAAAGINPLIHYIKYGAEYGYDPGPHFDTISYLESHPEVRNAGIIPLCHYLLRWKALGKSPESNVCPTPHGYAPDFEAWERGDKRALVFADDILPLGGLPSSGGSLRAWQIINMLKASGWNVEFSMPRDSFFVKKHWKDLTTEQKGNLWTTHNQGHLAKKHRPHLIVFMNPLSCNLPGEESSCVLASDLDGALNIEASFVLDNDLKGWTATVAASLNKFDVLVTATESQRIYWSALMTSAGRMPTKDDFVIVPVGFEPRLGFYHPDLENPVVVFAGSFYPWQDPSWALLETARYFETRENGELHIYGEPHEFCNDYFRDLFKQLSQFSRTKLLGFVSLEDLHRKIASAVCVLDIMNYNFEREIAVTTRTVDYLSLGVPVLYSNFNWLAERLSRYNAGWCLEPGNSVQLKAALDQVIADDASILHRKSENALTLARSEFAPTICEEVLDRILTQEVERHLHSTRSRYKRGHSSRQPRVLAVVPGCNPIKSLRLDGPLRSLLAQGLISSYTLISTSGHLLESSEEPDDFDCIWLQRELFYSDWFRYQVLGRLPFLLDWDDLLGKIPGYSRAANNGTDTRLLAELRECLKCCGIMSLTSHRLARRIQKYFDVDVNDHCVITPNAFAFPKSDEPTPTRPNAIVWTSSDYAALTSSKAEVLQAVDDFSVRRKLPIYCIGEFRSEVGKQLRNVVFLGKMDYWEHKHYLASSPTMIGIAPLETNADEATLDFVASKSDLKMVEYGGFGHPAVYSAAPPYTESDLQTGLIVENSYSAWFEAMEAIYQDGYAKEQDCWRPIRDKRHMNRIARECWYPALEKVRLERPFSFDAIRRLF